MKQLTPLLLVLVGIGTACTVTGTESIQIGNKAAVCFTITAYDATNNTLTKYWAFRTQIDRFSSFRFTELATALSNFSAINATVLAQFQNQASGLTQLILDTSLDLKRDFFSIVVNTIEGAYQSIVADNFCSGCGVCHQSQCFDSFSSTYSSKDLAVYISWAGSDVNKNDYLSSAMRLSRFSLYSVSSMYSNVQSSI